MPPEIQITDKTFLEGRAGSGKTTLGTDWLRAVLESGVAPERVLVLVPQTTYGRPYELAMHGSNVAGGAVQITTLAGIARKAIETYWPLVAEPMRFANPGQEPIFLNIETAQYYMARIANPIINEGRFDGVSVAPPRIISQVLDNLHKAALLRFPIDEVAQRLTSAWGEGHSSRPPVYEAAAELAKQFRQYCLEHNLLDFSLAIEAFSRVLLHDPAFTHPFSTQFDYLLADNVEEDNPAAHDFIRWMLPNVQGALLIYDTDAGYRIFLGADADYAYGLAAQCDRHETMDESVVMDGALVSLGYEFNRSIGGTLNQPEFAGDDPTRGFTYQFNHYYPQMLDWVAERIIDLVTHGYIEPREIAVLSPYLNDSLRFGLTYRLNQAGIETLSHRPSRALRDEPVTRTMLTLTALAHPGWTNAPALPDVADALSQVIVGLDPVRARLLAEIVYRPASGELNPFVQINSDKQMRITYLAGERYDRLRNWLLRQRERAGRTPIDHFMRRLFGEFLSQPGYGYHIDLEAGRVAGQLIASAQRFRQTLYPNHQGDWTEAGMEYLRLIEQRFLSALYPQSWQDEESNAVFIAPAFTFLMRNRFVDYQFWMDVGSSSWWERLEQPLTNPYVLRRNYPIDIPWTDELEAESQTDQLYRVTTGLLRRCRKQVYLGVSMLGEEGYEQRGPLLRVFQQIIRRHLPDQPMTGFGSGELA